MYPENFRVMNYDKLLLNPETEMRAMCDWLDIEYNPLLLEVTHLHGTPQKRFGWSMDGAHETRQALNRNRQEHGRSNSPRRSNGWSPCHFRDVLEEYDFEIHNPKVNMWRRFDRSEGPQELPGQSIPLLTPPEADDFIQQAGQVTTEIQMRSMQNPIPPLESGRRYPVSGERHDTVNVIRN